MKPEDLDNAIDSSASESSLTSDDDDDDHRLLGTIPFDEPLPEEMPMEDEEEEPPRMLFGDSEEEEEEEDEEQEEEDEDDSDWDVKKEKKKGGRKSLGGVTASSSSAVKKRLPRKEEDDSRDESAAEEPGYDSSGGRRKKKRRSVVARQRRKREENPESEEDEETRTTTKKRKGRKSAAGRGEEAGEESDHRGKGRRKGKKNEGSNAANGKTTTTTTKKGKKSTTKRDDSEEETEAEEEDDKIRGGKSSKKGRKTGKGGRKKRGVISEEEEEEEAEEEEEEPTDGRRKKRAGKGKGAASKSASSKKTRNQKDIPSSSKAESETSAAETDEGTDFEAAAAAVGPSTPLTSTLVDAPSPADSLELTGRGRRRKSLARRLVAADNHDSDSSVSTTTTTVTSASQDLAAKRTAASTQAAQPRRESMRKSARDRKQPRKFSPTSSCTSTRSLSKDLEAVSNADSASNQEVPADPLVAYEADEDTRLSLHDGPEDKKNGGRKKTEKQSTTTTTSSKNKGDKTTVWSFLKEAAQETTEGGEEGEVHRGMTIEDVEKAFEGCSGQEVTTDHIPDREKVAEGVVTTEEEKFGMGEGTAAESNDLPDRPNISNAEAIGEPDERSGERNEGAENEEIGSTAAKEGVEMEEMSGEPTAEKAENAVQAGSKDCQRGTVGASDVKPDMAVKNELVKTETVGDDVKKEDVIALASIGLPEVMEEKPVSCEQGVKLEEDEVKREIDASVDATGASGASGVGDDAASAAPSASPLDNLIIPENYVGPIETDIPPPLISTPDLTTFELVADSIDSLKELIRKLKRDPTWEPIVKEEEEEDEEKEGEEKEEEEKEKEDKSKDEENAKNGLKEGGEISGEKSAESTRSNSPSGESKMDAESGSNGVEAVAKKANDKVGKAAAKTAEEKREWELLEKLEDLLTELAPFERKLNDASRRMRMKLQKEVLEYKETKTEEGADGQAVWDSDIDEDDEIRHNTPSLSYDDNSNDPYYVAGGSASEMATDGGGRSLRANPRPSKRKLEMDRENALILQGVQDEYTDLCRSEEFDIVEVSSRGRVRKVRRLGISEEHERSAAANGGAKDGGGGTPKTASGRPARTGSRKSTPMMGEDDDDDDLMDEESNSSFVDSVTGGSVTAVASPATPMPELSIHERRSLASKKAAKTRAANQLQRQLAQQAQEGGEAVGKNTYAVTPGKKVHVKKDPEEVSREILANSKLNAAITAYKETGKLPEGMQLAGRGADGKPIVICAESIEQIKHLDNYKILTTLLTQKTKGEEKTFDGYTAGAAK